MEMSTIEMDAEQARAAFEEYATAVRARLDRETREEDEAIARGYKALADGKRLIDLPATLAAAGTTTVEVPERWSRGSAWVTVPRLAAIRAGARIAFTTGVDRTGGCLITAEKQDRELHPSNRRDRFAIPDGTFTPSETPQHSVRAIVPNIPPRYRPARGLHLYTILWEAEWAPDPIPPGDPALLRHLGGSLYVLVAHWDLTPLEQSVLAGRLG